MMNKSNKIEKAEVNEAINIASKMIKIYNERGGGYFQKKALNILIKIGKWYLRLLPEEKNNGKV